MNTFSADNSTVEYSLFQAENGGSTPTSALQISHYRMFPCKWEDLVPILKKYHYRREAIGGSIKVCLGVYAPYLIGGAVLGNPWHPEKFSDGATFNPIEIRRLCFLDAAPKNTESWAIGKVCWWLRKFTPYTRIISYSDTSVGHRGTIYKAAGFRLSHISGGGQKVCHNGREFHIRSLSIDRDYARDLAEAVKNGTAEIVDTGEKLAWVRDIAMPQQNAFRPYVPLRIEQTALFD